MKDKLKYPVKYSILELKKCGNSSSKYNEITIGFIVSKCYLVESFIKYLPDGKTKIGHKVVFPFSNAEQSLSNKENFGSFDEVSIVPSYNEYGNISYVKVIDDVFDDYESAREIANSKNELLRTSLISNIKFDDPDWNAKIDKLRKKFDKTILILNEYEEFIKENTKNMKVTSDDTKKYKLIKK